MCSAPRTGLLALVDELLLLIINQIDSKEALCNLASTCRRFQALSEPYIWRSLLVTNGDHARFIAAALDVREARADYVQELAIRYPDNDREGIQELNHFIVFMRKLRHLTIESPCPNNVEWNVEEKEFDGWTKIDYATLLEASVYPRKGVEPTLSMLQSLNLHGHGPGDRKFTFGRCAVVFLHPTIKRLTISCTNFDAKISHEDITDKQRKSTPLTSLTLIECNVNVHFLDVVLSLPKALKELDIGERLHAFSGCYPSDDITTRTSQPAFLKSLARQADSLEHLSHVAGSVHYLPPKYSPLGDSRLRHLTSLRTLTLGIETMLLTHVQRDDYPPSLQSLRILDVTWANDLAGHTSEETIRHPGKVFRYCTEVVKGMSRPVDTSILFSNENPESILSTITTANITAFFQSILQGPVRSPLYTLASLLQSSSRRLQLFTHKFASGKPYIPPYMYGEEIPYEHKWYDSEDYWRIRGMNFRVLDDEAYVSEVQKKPKMTCGSCKSKPGRWVCFNAGDGSVCIHCEKERVVDGKTGECVYDADIPWDDERWFE